MPQPYKYTSPKTGKTYNLNWNKPEPPTPQDFKNYEDWVGGQEISKTPPKSTSDKAWDIGKQFGNRLYETGKNFLTSSPAFQGVQEAKKYEAAQRDPNKKLAYEEELGQTREAFKNITPTRMVSGIIDPGQTIAGTYGLGEQTLGDIASGNYGGALANVGMVGAGLYGGYRGLARGARQDLLPQKPAVTVVPPVKPPLQLTEVAGAHPSVKRVIPPAFISHPSGKVARALDPNLAEGLRSLELERPGTTARSIDTRPGEFTNIGPRELPPVDLNVPGVRKGPEPYPAPRSQGIGVRPEEKARILVVKTKEKFVNEAGKKKIRTKTQQVPVGIGEDIATAIKNKKISGEIVSTDWLDDSPLYSHVPDRLRPEAPNVEQLRTLAEGGGKKGDTAPKSRVEWVSGPRDKWGGPASVVEIGEGLKGRVRNPKLDYTDEPILPSAPIRESILEQRRKAAIKAKVEKLPPVTEPTSGMPPISNMPPVSPIVAEATQRTPPVTIPPAKIEGKIEGIRGNLKYESFMKKNPVLKAITDKLIKVRSADKLVGKQVRLDFPDVAAIPKEKIVEFQEALGRGEYPKVREFFDKQHEELTKRGIDLGYKENYLPQMWDNPTEDIVRVFGNKELNKKASFQYHSFIEDYKKGIEAGLTPKKSPIELMEDYGKRANKLIADNEAIHHLRDQGYLVNRDNKTPTMQAMDPNLITFGKYYAEPDVKRVLEGYLKSAESQSPTSSILSKGVGKWSNLMLSSGIIPKPIFTMHGANIALPLQGRAYREGGIKRNIQALKYGWSPKKAVELLNKENPYITEATKQHGYSSGIGDVSSQGPQFFPDETGNWAKRLGKKTVNKLTGIQNRFFEKPLLEEMLPALKWEAWKDNYAKYIKNGMSETEAGKLATQVSDDYYGGKNLDLLYNNKTFNTFGRIALLAPDWFRTTFTLGKKTTAATNFRSNMSGPERMAYLSGASRWLATYAAANMLHKYVNGTFMVENSDPFAFKMGETADGKSREFKVFAGAADDFKLALQELKTAQEGQAGGFEKRMNFLENRFSPLAQAGLSAITGGNYKNETNIFRTRDQYGRPVEPQQRFANTLSQVVNMGPPQISAPANLATGKMGWEEALMRIAEVPISYKDKKKLGVSVKTIR